jgi:hypothetical protein
MTLPVPTAPQGTVTQASHNQPANRTIRWNATTAVNPGEAERSAVNPGEADQS